MCLGASLGVWTQSLLLGAGMKYNIFCRDAPGVNASVEWSGNEL